MFTKETRPLPSEGKKEEMDSIYEIYHENSKYDAYLSRPNFINIANLRKNPALLKIMREAYKTYPSACKVALPLPELATLQSFETIVKGRRSVRDYVPAALKLEKLSQILYLGYGITGEIDLGGAKQKLRASPSAGALYPLEIYLLVLNVEGLLPGIYHYQVLGHYLEEVLAGDYKNKVLGLFSEQDFLKDAALVILITAVFKRTTAKYQERGFRFILLDAGHLGQNICLTSAAYEVGCVAIGGFYEREIEAILGIDGVNESLIYSLALGTPSAAKDKTKEMA